MTMPAVVTAAFERVLCAIDGSPEAGTALEQAIALCGGDASLTVLAVTEAAGAEDVTEAAARAARTAGVDARPLVSHGEDIRSAILKEAEHHDLLVLGAHGHLRAAGYLLGSTATAALHHAPAPVLIARQAPDGAGFGRELLLATDGSTAMAPALDVTVALARRHPGRVTLVHVGRSDHDVRHELARETAAVRMATGLEPAVLESGGDPARRTADVARGLRASLVVTGSRELLGWHALGSVSERIATLAPCSVLVVRGTHA